MEPLIAAIVQLPITILVLTILLRAGAKWVEGLDITLGNAFVTVLLAGILQAVFGFVCGMLLASESTGWLALIASLLGWFLIESWIVGKRLSISFGRAALISLVMLGTWLGLVGIVFGIGYLVFRI